MNRALLPQFIALFSSQKDPELQEIWSPKVGASRPFFYCGRMAVKGEMKKRIKLAAACRMQLGNFWRKSAMNKKRKLQMYEALISAKLMCALDVTPLSPAAKTSLDAAFLRGVRQILNMKTTFAQKKAG